MEKHVVGNIIERFEKAGLKIIALKMIKLTKPLLEIWYAHHKDKPFFPDIVAQMTSSPVVAFVLEGNGSIQKI